MSFRPATYALAFAVFCAAAQAALLITTARAKSNTVDELTYIAKGADQITGEHISMNPVPAWGFGMALTIAGLLPEDGGAVVPLEFYWNSPRFTERLFAGRLATILITVLGGLFVWRSASRAGRLPAALAHALWCFSPLILGHGALATLDMWTASFLAVALWAAVRFVERPGPGWAALAGAATALAAGAKFPAGGAGLVFAAGIVVLQRRQPWRAVWSLLALAAAFAFTIWAACAFEVGYVTYSSHGHDFVVGPYPASPWLRQIVVQSLHGYDFGHKGYLAGEVYMDGRWSYYLLSLALQVPVAVQVLALVALAASVRRWRDPRARLLDVALLAYPVLLLVMMSAAKTQLGLRYLLPAAPFVLIWMAFALAAVPWRLPVALTLAATITAVSLHPHHLTFFNAWAGGPDGGTEYLVESIDWCQDVNALAKWQAEHNVPHIYYSGCTKRPDAWGVRSDHLRCKPSEGVYAVHVAELRRAYRSKAGCAAWLANLEPDERLNHTIWIYRIDDARAAALRAAQR